MSLENLPIKFVLPFNFFQQKNMRKKENVTTKIIVKKILKIIFILNKKFVKTKKNYFYIYIFFCHKFPLFFVGLTKDDFHRIGPLIESAHWADSF